MTCFLLYHLKDIISKQRRLQSPNITNNVSFLFIPQLLNSLISYTMLFCLFSPYVNSRKGGIVHVSFIYFRYLKVYGSLHVQEIYVEKQVIICNE